MDGIDDAAEFHDRAVADQLDDAPVVGGDRRIEYHLAVLLERGERALLVDPHQARIADHVGCEDRRELTVDAFFGHGRLEPYPEEIPLNVVRRFEKSTTEGAAEPAKRRARPRIGYARSSSPNSA